MSTRSTSSPTGRRSAPATSTATGTTDILWQNDNGTVGDWLGQADGSFTGNVDKVNILTGPDWHVIGTGDFNGDGLDDILWQNDNGTVRDWLGQADGSFVGNIDHMNIGTDWHAIGTGDFNGDGMTTSCGATTTAPSASGSARATGPSSATPTM